MAQAKPKIGFIVQRYGPEVVGGAETLCRALAERMSASWSIEVLTTCAKDYATWRNHFAPGENEEGGVLIQRFPVDRPRDPASFNSFDRAFGLRPHTIEEEREWMRRQGPSCPALTAHLKAYADEFDAFLFFGYLYATTHDNLPLVADRAWLMPFAHDEPPIYLKIFEEIFRRPRGLIHLTPEEQAFTANRFGFTLPPAIVTGIGVDAAPEADPDRFLSKFGIDGPFLFYAGRIDESKNAHLLIKHFIELKEYRDDSLSLIFAGKRMIELPRRDDICHLGFLSEADKADAFAAAHCFVLPSSYESLSIVILESWVAGRPVLVNADCKVALGQTQRARGGLWYRNAAEFRAAALQLLESPQLADQLGRQGREYALANYSWERIHDQLQEMISLD